MVTASMMASDKAAPRQITSLGIYFGAAQVPLDTTVG